MINFNEVKNLFTRDNLVSEPVRNGFFAGLAQVAFIFLIGIFILGTESLFAGNSSAWLMILGIVAFLILIVLSVAITGVLIFGWFIYYFFLKKYESAFLAFMGTTGALFLVFMIIFLLAFMVSLF